MAPPTRSRHPPPRFPAATIGVLDRAKIIGVRSGSTHRPTGVWPVVVEGRLFVRSWGDLPNGWYRAFLKEPLGTVEVAGVELAVRAVPVRSPRLRAAVSTAYALKYPTKGSEKWVRGFAEPERERHTVELVPAEG